jgi:hypothetical protein
MSRVIWITKLTILNILMYMRAKKAQTISHTLKDYELDFDIP